MSRVELRDRRRVLKTPGAAAAVTALGGGEGVTYMFPRSGEIVVGGSFQRGDWSRNPEREVTERIIADNKAVFDNLL